MSSSPGNESTGFEPSPIEGIDETKPVITQEVKSASEVVEDGTKSEENGSVIRSEQADTTTNDGLEPLNENEETATPNATEDQNQITAKEAPAWIENLHNTCYMSATFQSLFSLQEFWSELDKCTPKSLPKRDLKKGQRENLLRSLRSLQLEYEKQRKEDSEKSRDDLHHAIEHFYDYLRLIKDSNGDQVFGNHTQEDAAELVTYLLDTLADHLENRELVKDSFVFNTTTYSFCTNESCKLNSEPSIKREINHFLRVSIPGQTSQKPLSKTNKAEEQPELKNEKVGGEQNESDVPNESTNENKVAESYVVKSDATNSLITISELNVSDNSDEPEAKKKPEVFNDCEGKKIFGLNPPLIPEVPGNEVLINAGEDMNKKRKMKSERSELEMRKLMIKRSCKLQLLIIVEWMENFT